jgi:nitroreductase
MFIELIRKRRSTRRFKEDQIEAEKIEMLTEAALRAPSSRGFNPWQFVFVSDRELLKKLSRAKPAPTLKNRTSGSKMRPLPPFLFNWPSNRWIWGAAGYKSEKECTMIRKVLKRILPNC